MNDDTLLIGFKAVCNFVKDLSTEFGKKHKPLRLYDRLASNTQISHDKAIKKHMDIFQQFCITNRTAIKTKDVSKLTNTKLEYSDRVYIDIGHIFHIADDETRPVIWQHLLTISAIVDPSGKAKEVLIKDEKENSAGSDNFLEDIIEKVKNTVKPDANPMEAMASLMSSGLLTEVMTGLQTNISNGKLNFPKIMGTVQKLMGNMLEQKDTDENSKQMLGMLSGVMSNINNNQSGSPPDMNQLMGMFGTMMANMGNQSAQPVTQPDQPVTQSSSVDVVQTTDTENLD